MWLNRLQLSVCEHSRVCIKWVQFSVPWWIHGTVKPSCSDGPTQDADCVTIVSVTQVPILTQTRFYQPVNELNLTMKVAVNRPPNLVVLAWIDGELWHGQAQNGVNLAFQVKFDLEGQGQSPPKTIGTLTKLFCTFWPNLVVLAWTRGDLWRGQAQGWRTHTDRHTHRQTDAGNDNTRRPKLASGKNLSGNILLILKNILLQNTLRYINKV